MTRLLLQICTALLALIPIATGIVSLRGVRDPLYGPLGLPDSPVLDSNLRFFGGVWLGLGLAMLWTVPRIEEHGILFRALWVAGVGDSRCAPVHLLAIPCRPGLRGPVSSLESR